MKKSFVVILLLMFIMNIVVACNSKETVNIQNRNENLDTNLEESLDVNFNGNIHLNLSKLEEQEHIVYKTITDKETVDTIIEIAQNVAWENAKVLMSRLPDYKIHTINTDRTISYEPVTYALWITPQKGLLEVIIEGKSKYGKISEKDSSLLLSILESP